MKFIANSKLWFESFQNWQSEFFFGICIGSTIHLFAAERFAAIQAC